MIIVLLLFFQSICLYCQRLVLHVYDRWINPKNTRLLKEAAELTGNPKILQQPDPEQKKRNRKRYTTSTSGSAAGSLLSESCRFCANTPQGYCRHHFHLQEIEIQKQQRGWNPLGERESEYRQWRKANRELKRNLKNRFLVQQQQQEHSQQQFRRQRTTQTFYDKGAYDDETTSTNCTTTVETSSTSIFLDSGYFSMDTNSTITLTGTSSPNSIDCSPVETIYYFEPTHASSAPSVTSSSLSSGSYTQAFSVPVTNSTTHL